MDGTGLGLTRSCAGLRRLAVIVAALLLLAVFAGLAACASQSVDGDRVLGTAFEQRESGIQVTGSGIVTRMLPDDLDGDRHQRFIVELESGQTLLISHNIDIAPRIDTLAVGDAVAFHGVYEWNDEGGVVHWTHHDPDGSHEPGWLEHEGERYQ